MSVGQVCDRGNIITFRSSWWNHTQQVLVTESSLNVLVCLG